MKRVILTIVCAICWTSAHCSELSCLQELITHFYDDDVVVLQALSLHRVTESSWTPIVRELQRTSRSTYSLVLERARQSDINPLDPFQPEPAEKLLSLTMLEVFQGVMTTFLVTNPDGNRDMFDYIRRNQPLWKECFPPRQREGQ